MIYSHKLKWKVKRINRVKVQDEEADPKQFNLLSRALKDFYQNVSAIDCIGINLLLFKW